MAGSVLRVRTSRRSPSETATHECPCRCTTRLLWSRGTVALRSDSTDKCVIRLSIDSMPLVFMGWRPGKAEVVVGDRDAMKARQVSVWPDSGVRQQRVVVARVVD